MSWGGAGRVALDVSKVTCVFIFRVKQCNRTVGVYRTQLRNDKLIDHRITYSAAQESSTLKQPENLLLQSQTSLHWLLLSQPKLRCFPSHPIAWSPVSALSSLPFVDPVVVSLFCTETQTIHSCLNKAARTEHSPTAFSPHRNITKRIEAAESCTSQIAGSVIPFFLNSKHCRQHCALRHPHLVLFHIHRMFTYNVLRDNRSLIKVAHITCYISCAFPSWSNIFWEIF